MARDHARIHLSIWSDDDWRDLSPGAQWLYMHLLSSPSLNYAGVADWRPRRIARMANGWSDDGLERAALELEFAEYLLIDRDTEEALIRSFVRNDGILSKPNVAIAFCKAWQSVASKAIRGLIVWETLRLQSDAPDENAWSNENSAPWLDELLEGTPIPHEEGLEMTSDDRYPKGSAKGLEVAK